MKNLTTVALAFVGILSTQPVMGQEKPIQSVAPPRAYGIAVDGGVSNLQSPRFFTGHIFVGAKLGRFMLTTGLELQHKETAQGLSPPQTDALVSPYWGTLLQLAILRSRDQRVEFLGIGGFAYGKDGEEFTSAPRREKNDNFVIRYGVGIQFWALPQLAFSLTTGVAYRIAHAGFGGGEGLHYNTEYDGFFSQLRVVVVP